MARSHQIVLAVLLAITGVQAAPQPRSPPNSRPSPEPTAGPGGSSFKDSAHFRVYGASDAAAEELLGMIEGAYECFVNTLGWRSSGPSFNDEAYAGTYYKTNVYSVSNLDSAIFFKIPSIGNKSVPAGRVL